MRLGCRFVCFFCIHGFLLTSFFLPDHCQYHGYTTNTLNGLLCADVPLRNYSLMSLVLFPFMPHSCPIFTYCFIVCITLCALEEKPYVEVSDKKFCDRILFCHWIINIFYKNGSLFCTAQPVYFWYVQFWAKIWRCSWISPATGSLLQICHGSESSTLENDVYTDSGDWQKWI